MRSRSVAAALPRRGSVVIAGCILLLTALAWAYLVYLDRRMSSSAGPGEIMMNMGMAMDAPWGASDVFFTFLMWSVMMVGMMSPSAIPVLLLFAQTQARRPDRVPMAVTVFGLGYIAVWFGFSALAALAQWALHEAAFLSSRMAVSSPLLAGAVLIAAGVYQLTPAKGACLSQCQSPLGFLLSNWREGASGAFRMGVRHGFFCLGCCWALMAVLFAVGVMNLAWVVALSAFILLEKSGPAGVWMARTGGVIMITYGIFLAAS